MNKILLSFTVFCLISPLMLAENTPTSKGVRIKDNAIYLILDGNKLEYFTGHQSEDNRKKMGEITKFSLDNNTCNIYLKWINPLKYQLSFRDTVYIDERDKIIADFIKDLAGQFGIFAETSETKESRDSLASIANTRAGLHGEALYIPEDGFNDIALNNLYLSLRAIINILNDADIRSLNALTKLIEVLDAKNSTDINAEIKEIYTDLFNLENPDQARIAIKLKSTGIEKFNRLFQEIQYIQDAVLKNLQELNISDRAIGSFTKATISEFVYRTSVNLNLNKNLVIKLESVVDIVRNSLDDESVQQETKGYFRVKYIEFEEGKKLESSFEITKFRLNPDTLPASDKNELVSVEKTDVIRKTMVFEKYDFIRVWGSLGLFYSSASLAGYGFAINPAGELTVTHDTIERNSAVTALFLNFEIDLGSRYLAPVIQLGIDPTKTRPFILLGGGLSIPCKQFAFTGGWIWTWEQSLSELSVGQTIWSSTYLEKDIRYEFNIKPKGWYLGIQFKF